MTGSGLDYPITHNCDTSGAPICDGGNTTDVAKEDRKRRVLSFLVDSRLALPRTVLYRNLRYRGADFSESSLKNYLSELKDEGYVERIDAEEFAVGNVIRSNDDPGYWVATGEGAEYIEGQRAGSADDIDTSHL